MKPNAAASAVLFLVGWLCMACQSRLSTPVSTALPTKTLPPSLTWTSTSTPLSIVTLLDSLTETPTSEPLSTRPPTPSHTLAPTPTLSPLTDAEALELLEKEVTARGVDFQTIRITMSEEPRLVSIRYSSSFAIEDRPFQAQTVLVALAAARVLSRVQPPIDGGIRLAVMPGGEGEVGLRVTIITGSSMEAWINGSISDQEFVSLWMAGTVTRE